jgi:hypothetical protein
MGAGLVCDLEYNVTYTAEWYATFQATVAQLAAPVVKPRKRRPMIAQYVDPVTNELALAVIGANGHVLAGTRGKDGVWAWWDTTTDMAVPAGQAVAATS